MQIASFWISTRLAELTPYHDNRYTTSTSKCMHTYIPGYFQANTYAYIYRILIKKKNSRVTPTNKHISKEITLAVPVLACLNADFFSIKLLLVFSLYLCSRILQKIFPMNRFHYCNFGKHLVQGKQADKKMLPSKAFHSIFYLSFQDILQSRNCT